MISFRRRIEQFKLEQELEKQEERKTKSKFV